MLEIKYMHYIRINKNNEITHAFSNAFEQPQKKDILLRETEQRHCQLNVLSEKYIGKYKYKYIDGKIIKKTDEELYTIEERKADKIKAIKAEAKTKIETTYPLWKQINLIAKYDKDKDTDANKTEMVNFINNIRKWSDEEESKINKEE
jgi:hypothetical protein